eukprot:gnl/TRDRNA2_/TRDRNA2_74445_c1_seq1.p1 gnl/TRDRNA2_/TRDRNA2_74445_c1~~gnl/TRDRNA2_/TRDRNA2_74445_c1_seq1.p1  ORF type:complete len:365 (-),score=59.01 gnl/TRDRNA2_/TRDRNA2_74445_c1_seq1:75-1076(-)
MGLVPDGGMTYVLARLRWNFGEFLALTGMPVRGQDLVYCELVQHWLSPDALPFLELTGEKHLEVSEADSRALLDEHSLPLDTRRGWSFKEVVPLIQRAFSKGSIGKIKAELEDARKRINKVEARFAEECLMHMNRACPLALHVTHELIRRARSEVAKERRDPADFPRSWDYVYQGLHGEHGALAQALRLELRAQQQMLSYNDALIGLHARCLGQEVDARKWTSWTDMELDDQVTACLREPGLGGEEDFVAAPRHEMSLSTHPRLRRYHPDYNEATGLDYDPAFMAGEVKRWNPELFAQERTKAIEALLGGEDPAAFGEARWVRAQATSAFARS